MNTLILSYPAWTHQLKVCNTLCIPDLFDFFGHIMDFPNILYLRQATNSFMKCLFFLATASPLLVPSKFVFCILYYTFLLILFFLFV